MAAGLSDFRAALLGLGQRSATSGLEGVAATIVNYPQIVGSFFRDFKILRTPQMKAERPHTDEQAQSCVMGL